MNKILNHIERWNKWRKFNANSCFYKLLVLLKLRESPTMRFVLTDKEEKELRKAFSRGLDEGTRQRIYTELGLPKTLQREIENDADIAKAWETFKTINNIREVGDD